MATGNFFKHWPTMLLGLVVAAILLVAVFSYQLNQTESAVVTTFGRPTEVTEPGLHFRWPFPFQRIYRFDHRIRCFEGGAGKLEETMTADGQKPGLLNKFIYSGPSKMRVAFVNRRSPEVSGWTYWHELGKNRIETVFGDKVETRMVNDVTPENCQQTIESLIAEGSNIIFTTSPVLLDGAMKAAVRYPDVKILNCSLLPSYHTVRSYYLRMYEAKFVIGAIAGAVCENDRIGYIADYPVYGSAASINAFALGARLTNPRAKVYLEWSTIRDHDPLESLKRNGVRVICNRDISAPSHQSMEFGLYSIQGETTRNLAMPVWNWGRLYEDLLRRVQSGMWRTDALVNGAQEVKLFGEPVQVKARIAQLGGLSGHADCDGLAAWLHAFDEKPKFVFVNHGEDAVAEHWAEKLRTEGYEADAPYNGSVWIAAEGRVACAETGNTQKIIRTKSAEMVRTSAAYDRLVNMGKRLMEVTRHNQGGANKDLAKFASQIAALCDKWDR